MGKAKPCVCQKTFVSRVTVWLSSVSGELLSFFLIMNRGKLFLTLLLNFLLISWMNETNPLWMSVRSFNESPP